MRHSRALVAVVSLVLALVVPSQAPSRTRPQPCDGGRYFVDGDVVLVPGGAAPDVVRIGDSIEILSGCPAVNVKTRLQKSGTSLKATFKGCSGLAGNATLKGKIAAGCATMKATFRSKKDKIKTPFTATLSVCGDGRFDPENGNEECDAGQGACGAGACNAECVCTSLPTTTVAPTTTSTSTSSSTSTSVTPTTQAFPTTAPPTTSTTSTTAPSTSSTSHAPTTTTHAPTTTTHAPTTTTTSTSAPSTSSSTATPTTTTSSTAPPATVPDLRPTAFSSSALVVDAGSSLTVSWTVKNEGLLPANQPWTDYVYFNSTGNVGGTFIGEAHSQNLAVNDTYSVTNKTFNIPNVPAGTYYLVLQVDGNNNVNEGPNESDNVWPTPIQITVRTPDLRPTAFSSSTMIVDAGSSLTVSWSVVNEGTAQAKQPWTDYVYFNSTGNVGGTFIGSARSQNLPAGDSYSVNTQTFNLPNVPAGTYYLVLQVDGNNNVYEGSDESDNTYPTTIQLTVRTPDLRATAFSVDDQTVSVGQMVHISWTVTNEGTAQAKQPWTDYAYFNATGNVGGTFIGAAHSSDLAAAGSYSVTNQTFTIPSVTPGSYFLVLQVDGNNNVYEGNQEGDNVFPTVIPITVQ